ACGRLRFDQHVRNRRTVVSRARFWWDPVDEAGYLREAVATHLRGRVRQIQDADPRRVRRAGLPCAVHAEPGVFFRAPAPGRAVKTHCFSRRGTLDSQTAEQPFVVRRSARLVAEPSQLAVADIENPFTEPISRHRSRASLREV